MAVTNTFNPAAAVNTGTDVITIVGHGYQPNQGVIYTNGGGSSIGGLVDGFKYYVIWITADTFKLANTEVEARAGTAVDLLSTGTGASHLLVTSNIFPNSAAYYDFFRKIRLLGTGLPPDGTTLEADSVRDTLNIIGGQNIYITDVNQSTDSFVINAPDYNFEVPLGTTNLRLYSDQGDDQAVTITPVRGIAITRIGPQELGFESFGVTETDTLHTVASRGNITSQQLILKDLLVGFIESVPGVDGFISTSVSAGDAITGSGTLDSPLILSPDESQRTDAAHTVTINFSSPGQGTMNYTAVYKTTAVLASGSVTFQRKNPSTLIWETLDSVSGTTERTSYQIENIYAEPESSPVDFRIIFDWTGNFEYVNYRIRLTYELAPIATKQLIYTDTTADTMVLGTDTSSTLFRSQVTHDGPNIFRDYIDTEGLRIFKNNIEGTNSNDNIIIDPHGTGKIELRTNDLITDQTTFNIINDVATTVNAFSAATIINVGANSGTVTVGNPTIVGTQTTQNLWNTVATTVNAFGDASTLNIGDNTGTLTLRNPTVVGTETTQTVYDTVATTVNAFRAATTLNIGNFVATGSTVDTADSSGITFVPAVTTNSDLTVENDLTVRRATTIQDTLLVENKLTVNDDVDINGDVYITGTNIDTSQSTFNLLTTPTTINAFGSANTAVIATNALSIQLGNFTLVGSTIDTDDSSGITFVPVVTLNSDLNVENDLAITRNISVGSDASITGSLTVGGGIVGNSTLTVDSNAVFKADVEIRGGDITTDQTTFNLLNTVATTINAFGAASTINLRNLVITSSNTIDSNDSSGITFIPLVTFNSDVNVENDLIVTGNLTVNGTTVTLNTTTLDVEDLNITVARGAPSAAAANGAGVTVDGASATITYASADDSWNFNKLIKATSLQATPIGTSTRAAGNFTTLNANSNVTIGAADTDTITIGGSFVTGTALRTSKTSSNTLSLAAYDVDGTTYSNLITLTASNTPTLTITSTGVGTLDNITIGSTTSAAGTFTDLTATGWTTLSEVTETLTTKTAATGVVVHDLSTGTVFHHSTVAANFTANFTNVPTTTNRVITISMIIVQGVAGYYPSAVQIDGVAQTINWAGNVTPTPSVSRTDVVSFTLIRTGSSWSVLGSMGGY